MTQHAPIKNITVKEAILRIRDYCKEHHYIVSTNDYEAKSFANNVLTFHQPLGYKENYKISTVFNFDSVHVTEGTLIEILYDFKLLNQNERIALDFLFGVGQTPMMRRCNIRLPWDREDVLL